MVTIALDAMGGDHFPKPEVEGAVQAVKTLGVKVILVGKEDVVRQELQRHPGWQSLPIEIRHASEQITMEDSAGKAVRAKKDSSIRVASRLVKTGEAHCVVSAGNTGAVMATAKMVQGMLPGVDRPALASAFPTLKGSAVMLDVGANVDSSPQMLAQFAVMGDAFARVIYRKTHPRVGLLSIGEEEHKGNALTHDAFPLLKALQTHKFCRQRRRPRCVLWCRRCDCLRWLCRQRCLESKRRLGGGSLPADAERISQRDADAPSGGYLARGAFADFRKRVDYAEYGGAPLLGLNGLCVICHGRSTAKAIRNAIRIGKEFAEGRINERIATELNGRASTTESH